MSVRNEPLFDARNRPTPFLMRQWKQKGGQVPLINIGYLDRNYNAEPHFRMLWQKAFPTRGALPDGPLATRDGRGTDAFWDVFS